MNHMGPLDDYPIHQDAKVLRDPATPHPDFDDATYFFITDREGELSIFSTLEGIGFVENLVAPGSRYRGIPPTEMADVDPGEFDEDD